MTTRTLAALVAALTLTGAGVAGCGDDHAGTEQAAATTATPRPVIETDLEFPTGRVTKSGVYRVKVVDQDEAERLCGAMRDEGWPEVYANHDEVRFAFPGPDLTCVPY